MLTPKTRELIQRALDRSGNTHTVEDVESEIEHGDAELWEFGDCAMVTEVTYRETGRDLHVWLAAGELEQLLLGVPQLDNIARHLGCDRVTIDGRKGWERVLTGYRAERVFLVRGIDKG